MRFRSIGRTGILAVFIVSACLTLFRIVTTPAPIYASDEYAYLKHGKDFGRVDAEQEEARDPGLQQLSNYAYFWIVRCVAKLSDDPTLGLRATNFICYFVCLPLLGELLLSQGSRKGSSIWFVGLLSVLPASVFVLSPMPEIVFATAYTAIAVITVLTISIAPIGSSVFAGVALATLAYIKPHAVAAMIGFGAYFSVYCIRTWNYASWRRRLIPVCFSAAILAGIFLINLAVLKQPSVIPSFSGGLYAGAVQSTFSMSHLVKVTGAISTNALLHAIILIVIFPLAFASLVQAVARLFRRHGPRPFDTLDNLGLLTGFCAAGFVIMTADYTYYAGTGGESQSNRLLGRYLIVIFPSLLLMTSHMLSTVQTAPTAHISRYLCKRWVIGVLVLGATFTCYLLWHAKLFPWDYPELFSLYSTPNSYWGWTPAVKLRWAVLIIGAGIFAICLAKQDKAPVLLAIGQAGFFAASLLQTTFWQETHARTNERLSAVGRALRIEAGPNAEDLVLVASSRYGEVSYVLCGLMANPWVKISPLGSELGPGSIPAGARFIATLGSYKVNFPFAECRQQGPVRIYSLGTSAVRTCLTPIPLWDRKPFVGLPDKDSDYLSLWVAPSTQHIIHFMAKLGPRWQMGMAPGGILISPGP
jgi:hypothetical protein